MKPEDRFIILYVADTYLMNDFEYSLRLSTNDFSSICTTSLFEGNILRFRALASLKLYELGLEDDLEFMQSNFEYLTTAIASLENALQIYKAEKEARAYDQNHYGVALSAYSIGYTYETYSTDLSPKEGQFKELCKPEH